MMSKTTLKMIYWIIALGWVALSGYIAWLTVDRIQQVDGNTFHTVMVVGTSLLSALMARPLAWWITRWIEVGSSPKQ